MIQQIVSAVDGKFLQALRSPITTNITKTIPEIFTYLFDNYGQMSSRELSALKTKLEEMTFELKEPVDTIFTEINDFANIANIVKSPLTEQQKIDIGIIVLTKARPFQSYFTK